MKLLFLRSPARSALGLIPLDLSRIDEPVAPVACGGDDVPVDKQHDRTRGHVEPITCFFGAQHVLPLAGPLEAIGEFIALDMAGFLNRHATNNSVLVDKQLSGLTPVLGSDGFLSAAGACDRLDCNDGDWLHVRVSCMDNILPCGSILVKREFVAFARHASRATHMASTVEEGPIESQRVTGDVERVSESIEQDALQDSPLASGRTEGQKTGQRTGSAESPLWSLWHPCGSCRTPIPLEEW